MKKSSLLILFLLFCIFVFSQTEWSSSNNGLSDKFNTYDFIVGNSNEVYAVGALFNEATPTPKIFKSVNNGTDWTEISVSGMDSHNYLYSASCKSGDKMFINASNNSGTYAIYSSINSSTWTLSNNGIPEKFNTFDFIVVSNSEIYAIGSQFDGTTFSPKIFKSVNNGIDWTEISVSGMDSHNYLYSASCKSGDKMFINASNNSGTYAIYSSTNSSTWILSNNGIPEKFNTYDFIIASNSEIYAVGALFDGTDISPKIYKSENNGTEWSEISVSGIDSHDYLYSASCLVGNKMLLKASSNSAEYSIYSSTISITDIDDSFSIIKPVIYPNPTSCSFLIDSNRKFDEVHIRSLSGVVVAIYKAQSNYNISNLESSIYFIELLQTGKIVYSEKILKN